MEDWSWALALLGAALTALVLVDVFLTVLHVDTDGPVASSIFQIVWRPLISLSRRRPRLRRSLVGLAAPTIIVVTFAAWVALFVVAFALIYSPFMGLFRADREFALLGFAEALYFSGVTATVLGYGDVTPMHGGLQVLSFVQSGLGFALFTGIITYLINVVSGVADRNALARRLWLATERTGDGTWAVVRSLAEEGSEGLHLRLHLLLPSAEQIHQKMHQFPILDLFYRSKDPVYSPEIMFRIIVQMALASRLAASDPRHGRLGPPAEELAGTAEKVMKLIAEQHLSREVQARLHDPAPGPEDEQVLEDVREALANGVPDLELSEVENEDWLLETVFRTRVLLDALEALTAWRMDDPPRVR